MIRRHKQSLATIALLLSTSPYALSQTSSHSEPLDRAVDAEGLIRLTVSATDASRNLISNLQRADFTILDDNHPQPLVAFRSLDPSSPDPSSRIILLLVIDTLNAPAQLAYLERQQAIHLLRSNGGHLAHPTILYTLTDAGCFLTAKSSTDGNALAKTLAPGNSAGIPLLPQQEPTVLLSTLIKNSILKTPLLTQLRALATLSVAEDRLPGKKLILWITAQSDKPPKPPERPDSSERQNIFGDIYWFSTLLRQAGISLSRFTVESPFQATHPPPPDDAWHSHLDGVSSANQASWQSLDLNVLAIQSGGAVHPPSQDILQQLQDTLHQNAGPFYQLTFNPPPAAQPNEYHALHITLATPGLTASTRTGYYNQPFYNDPPDPSIHLVTVAQLQQLIHAANGGREAARQLPNLALTQRLDTPTLNTLSPKLHSKSARETLSMIADESKFLDPPPSESIPNPPPDHTTQQRILASALSYLDNAIPRLPDFFATRNATNYTETAAYHELDTNFDPIPLHAAQHTQSTVLYRNNHEVVDHTTPRRPAALDPHMLTIGIFGPILNQLHAILSTPADLTWSRWQSSPSGRVAVFHFASSISPSVNMTGCCIPDGDGTTTISAPIHGELDIDPTTGAILRAQVQSNLEGFVPTSLSNMMVTYGPVLLGGKTYILPLHSVNIWRARSVVDLRNMDLSFRTWGPYQSQMNVFTFTNYRLFHGSEQILWDAPGGLAPH